MARRRTKQSDASRRAPARAVATASAVATSPAPAAKTAAAAPTEPQALVATYVFDPGAEGEPYAATIRMTGRRAGVAGRPRDTDSFVREEVIDRIVPGSGPVSVSMWVYDVTAGEWSVNAELIRPRRDAQGRRMPGASRPEVEPLRLASWSWRRWSVAPGPASALLKTRWALLARLARIPAVMPGTITLLVAIGAVLLLILQSALLESRGASGQGGLVVSAIASVAGLVAAKLWHVRLNPQQRVFATGWAVDGFMIVAPLAAIAALLVVNVPVLTYLDATTPGLFLTVALGRVGCFLTGCCAGRATTSRFGVWCSDQKVGARRIPTQLLESGTGLVLGVTTLTLAVTTQLLGSGVLFVGAFGTYMLVRHFLLRLRAQPRRFLWQRAVTEHGG